MAKLVAVTSCPTGIAHTFMAAEALKKTADFMGHGIAVETHGAEGVKGILTEEQIAGADAVIIASDTAVDLRRFEHKKIISVTTSEAIRRTSAVIESALQEVSMAGNNETGKGEVFIVAVTSCPTGIAHTFMAAEALKKAANELGYRIKVETQGSVGAKNLLTDEEIEQADAVVIAADTSVDKSRFFGKKLYETSTKKALHEGAALLEAALHMESVEMGAGSSGSVGAAKKEKKAEKRGPYKHLMTGVSYMIPFVVAGGLLIALGFALGGIYVYKTPGTFGETLFSTGKAAMALMLPILGAFIAYSIADRPGLVPGMIGGFLAANNGSGFLGAMAAGFLAGYTVVLIKKYIKLPNSIQGLMPVLVIPLLSTVVMGVVMFYVIGKPIAYVNTALSSWLTSLSGTSAALLGVILGLMMAFDMGGPVNKAAYAFGTATVVNGQSSAIMAAVMVSGMVPPLALALSTVLTKKKYTLAEREAGKAAWALGISFITEGAIPFAAADPLRVIPSIMAGGAVAGGLSMALGCKITVPHGGIWVLPIPNVVVNLLPYIIALVAGTVISALLLSAVKKTVTE